MVFFELFWEPWGWLAASDLIAVIWPGHPQKNQCHFGGIFGAIFDDIVWPFSDPLSGRF